MGGVQAPWARPAGQVLLPLLSCTQLGPHWLLLEHRNRMWSLQRESQEEGPPSGPAVAPRALFPFLNGVSLRSHLTFLSLSPNVLSCHLTQPFAPDTALFQTRASKRSNNDNKGNDNDLERPQFLHLPAL